jgi:predicted secreted protein/uncharacterized lipoprotein NlpE involved in copper resistance
VAWAFIAGCEPDELPVSRADGAAGEAPTNEPSLPPDAGEFVGVLPCADCAGIRTVLRMRAERPSGRPIDFELRETYLGTPEGDRTFVRIGRWTILRGMPGDNDATVYQLDFDRSRRERSFLRIGHDELRLLDREQREIDSDAPVSLWRVRDMDGEVVTLSESDAGHTLELDLGERVAIRLRVNRSSGYEWVLTTAGTDTLKRVGNLQEPGTNGPAAAQTETWLFEVQQRGLEELRFDYRRPLDEPPARTVAYTITVP